MTNPYDIIHSFSSNEFMEGNYAGLNKREHFASLAMQGILSDQKFIQPNQSSEVVKYAVELADALISELNKEEK